MQIHIKRLDENFLMEAKGDRVETTPKVFDKIHIHYILEGDLEEEKVKKAIGLSLEKYCSVSKMLEKTAQIDYTFEIKK